MPDCVLKRNGLRVAALAAALALLSNCAQPDTSGGTGKLSDTFATPEWAKFTSAKPVAQRPITPDDLITADGRCAGNAVLATDGSAPDAPDSTSEALAGQGQLPALQGGVALAMTECQVLGRTGSPDRVDIGAEGTERITTMTVLRGDWPGLYRFRGGRLVSIERVEVPAPPKPAKGAKSKKAAQKQQQPMPLRGSQ